MTEPIDDNDDIQQLNLDDLDVKDLEQRLEMASLVGADCWNNQCGVNKG